MQIREVVKYKNESTNVPLLNSTISSLACTTRASVFASTFTAAMSFTRIPMRMPEAVLMRCSSRVVLPAPSQPHTVSTGTCVDAVPVVSSWIDVMAAVTGRMWWCVK